ncbi:class F sortase [Kitasatospora sp. NA04385]|uniref:class F sortase n=1 Tax=Kitasatospora sp. NA04385 TaxID=2742135 RepID=UPI0015907364|nr:class F sortase [Kitasatospora sp. NA04385]QKW20185.1 class F sortase [Kitasatospora sp. NA04385]
MPHRQDPPLAQPRRRGPVVLLAAAALLGAFLVTGGREHYQPPPQPGAAQALSTASAARGPDPDRPATAPAHSDAAPSVAPMAPSTPTRVRIPSIGVDAPLTALDLGPNRQLAAPPEDDRNLAGWYRGGTTPGATGTAIIAGHVDNHQGPAVFYNLGALKKDLTVQVQRADRTTAVFTIDAVQAYAADGFPDDLVYGPSTRPELRLITCGAGFDKQRKQYLGNVVVFAHLTSTTSP